jgi:hypothetical protein
MGQTLLKCFQLPTTRSLSLKREKAFLSDAVSSFPLNELPSDVLIYNIFPYLTYRDLCRLSQTNRYLNDLIETQIGHLWKKCIKDEMLGSNIYPNKHATLFFFGFSDIKIKKKINVTYLKINKTTQITICPGK